MTFSGHVANPIINEVKSVYRVVYDDVKAAGDHRAGVTLAAR